MDDYQVCRTSIAVDLPFPPNLIFVVLPSYSAISSFYPIFCLEFSLRGGSCAGLPLFWRISVCLFGSKGTLLSDECDAIEPVCRVSLSEIKGVCTFAKLELIKTHKSK